MLCSTQLDHKPLFQDMYDTQLVDDNCTGIVISSIDNEYKLWIFKSLPGVEGSDCKESTTQTNKKLLKIITILSPMEIRHKSVF